MKYDSLVNNKFLFQGNTMNLLTYNQFQLGRIFNFKHIACRHRRMCSTQPNKIGFTGLLDRYNGVTVEVDTHKYCQQIFTSTLTDSLIKWKSEGRRCIWFKVNIHDALYIPLLAEKGFNFHHAQDGFVMMYKWLPTNLKPNLPPSSYTNVGVGAIVFNSEGKLLTISEKNYDYPHWKLPGGYVEKGENLTDAAIREVKEETGIDSAFESLVTFRHTHNMTFNNSDFYIILRLKALSENIIMSDRELNACKWMDIKEYTTHPHVHEFNKLIVLKAIEYKEQNIKLDIQQKTMKWATVSRDINILLINNFG